ncbi:MAG: RNA pseudouridine synthase [Lentimicrobiaceae bacterium]|mgnify:CR=1 FL=1|jgi:23S rRNA pseudouridine1911/1915/1917 synthase|nr:RNA pseudouridine synthase [Lentimicrobiaceae bacterium]MDG1901875.1 RluA family pseudouridine synthase [Bacteroidales bacterium]MDG2081020.1 RluA family pseudouridine synthase [Bacteroidales bacterium]|tara:strand:- start:6093 stop:7148 length:1056 start_codon:yes stop_codon:yes gene_type:complete
MTDNKTTDSSDDNFELYEHHNIVVDDGQSPVRIDKFLFGKIINVSRNKVQQAAKAGNILVNGNPAKSNYKVRPADEISVVMSYPPRDVEIFPEDIELNVVYEDDDIIVINKQPGLVVHPGHANYSGTMLNGLMFYFNKTGKTNIENGFGYMVHRIDKDTSGLILVAKNEMAQTKLAKQFFNHSVDRAYEALVWGDVLNDTGTITGHIGRSLKDRRVMTVFPDGEYGKEAVSHYKVLQRYGYITHVECKLETGRTHQIRAHFSYLGHPLFNDARYGGDGILKGTTFTKYKQFIQNCFKLIPRQSLHARSLGFVHPTTGSKMHFESPLNADMLEVISKWDGYVSSRKDDDFLS